MTAEAPQTLLISCGALAQVVVRLIRENGWDHFHVECLPAHLHNAPERIPEAVRRKIRSGRERYDDVLVLYSDCGTGGGLDRVLYEEGVERIGGAHCYEMFSGSADFRALREAEPGCFFLTDFLARNFERLVYRGLGLDRFPKLREVYFGRYTKVLYLAQSDDPELTAKAQHAADLLGLPLERRYTGPGTYRDFLAARAECALQDAPTPSGKASTA